MNGSLTLFIGLNTINPRPHAPWANGTFTTLKLIPEWK